MKSIHERTRTNTNEIGGPRSTVHGLRSTVHAPRRPTRTRVGTLHGFSLAELMVAIGILGIGLLIVACAFPVGIDQTRQGVEIATAQLVFQEARQALQVYVSGDDMRAAWGNCGESLRPSSRSKTNDIRLLGPANGVFPRLVPYNNDPKNHPEITDCVYDADLTYGWLAAAEKVGRRDPTNPRLLISPPTANGKDRCTYRFWIFVLREPTGVVGEGQFKFTLVRMMADYRGGGQVLIQTPPDWSPGADPQQYWPNRGSHFLANNGQVYTFRDLTTYKNDYGPQCAGMCDRDFVFLYETGSPGWGANSLIAYAIPIPEARVTRRAPVVAVYETVISYEE